MFSLDYRTISQTLQTMHYTGFVRAFIPSGKFARGTVVLKVQGGIVQICVVTTADGKQVNDTKRIVEQLARCGILEWHLSTLVEMSHGTEKTTHVPSIPTTPAAPPFAPDIIHPRQQPSLEKSELSPMAYPRRFRADSAWIKTWPLTHRQVYNISTGQYNEQDIARLLRYSPADLLKVLQDLERMEVLRRGI